MRYLRRLFFLLLLASVQASFAESIRLTIYDDGLSCPGNCDAHAVFHQFLNGTEFAHDPTTKEAPYEKCKLGSACRLCLESGGKQCLEALYRGGGPPPKTFDFTPAFYAQMCEHTPSQQVLASKCSELKSAASKLVGRINCIATPSKEECFSMIETAQAARSSDRAVYEQCKREGELDFNASRPRSEQRTHQCAYEKYGTGGPNSKGKTWRKLLPGACRDGTFVGRDGLDCCSGNILADGPLGRECDAFYPNR